MAMVTQPFTGFWDVASVVGVGLALLMLHPAVLLSLSRHPTRVEAHAGSEIFCPLRRYVLIVSLGCTPVSISPISAWRPLLWGPPARGASNPAAVPPEQLQP